MPALVSSKRRSAGKNRLRRLDTLRQVVALLCGNVSEVSAILSSIARHLRPTHNFASDSRAAAGFRPDYADRPRSRLPPKRSWPSRVFKLLREQRESPFQLPRIPFCARCRWSAAPAFCTSHIRVEVATPMLDQQLKMKATDPHRSCSRRTVRASRYDGSILP